MSARLLDSSLLTESGGDPRLIGLECTRCGVITFPRQTSCPSCTSLEVRERLLGREGTLWSWTIQSFPPKSPPYALDDPDRFEPYGVGYVELPGEVRVESLLTVADPDSLGIGMPMRLTLIPAPGAANGLVTFAFAPAQERGR